MEGTQCPLLHYCILKVDTLINDIREKTEELLPGKNYFVVEVSFSGGKGYRKLKILIDSDQGIDIDACSTLSRELSEWLDLGDLIEGPFTLEVGSPGIDYPLSMPRQFRKNLGRIIKVVKNDHMVSRGKLLGVDDQGIVIGEEGRSQKQDAMTERIDFGEIMKATVIVSFK